MYPLYRYLNIVYSYTLPDACSIPGRAYSKKENTRTIRKSSKGKIQHRKGKNWKVRRESKAYRAGKKRKQDHIGKGMGKEEHPQMKRTYMVHNKSREREKEEMRCMYKT